MEYLTEEEIQEIYTTHVVKPENYFTKYSDMKTIDLDLQQWSKRDCPRLFSVLEFREWSKKYGFDIGNKLFYTYKKDFELPYIHYTEKYFLDYETNKNNDLHTLDSNKVGNDFDFVLFNHTLEHLYNPLVCMKNLYSILKPGGFLYTAVPILSIPHDTPFHFSGFTPMGLAVLCKLAGFDIKEVGYWGNKKYLELMYKDVYWPDIFEMMDQNKIVKNDPEVPVQTWILVQKPEVI